MKREILFRGQSINTGKWVESMTIARGTIKRKKDCVYLEVDEKWIGVIPETIGQFTGLTDKNGVNIFEGDILSHIDRLKGYDSKMWQVIFYSGSFFMSGLPRKIRIYNIGDRCHECEVIGNIYDNPELIK